MKLLEHAGWWALIAVAIVVAVALNSGCGNEYKCCGNNHLYRDQAITIMQSRCAEHGRVFGWTEKSIDNYTGAINWTCHDGTVGSQEYDTTDG